MKDFREWQYSRNIQDIIEQSNITADGMVQLEERCIEDERFDEERLNEFVGIAGIAAYVGWRVVHYLGRKLIGRLTQRKETPKDIDKIKQLIQSGDIDGETKEKLMELLKGAAVPKKEDAGILKKSWKGLKKATKVVGGAAVVGALVYVGFRFDAIREFFPWLVPVVDQVGDYVAGKGSEFLSMAWDKVIEVSPVLAVALKDVLAAPFIGAWEWIKGAGENAADALSGGLSTGLDDRSNTKTMQFLGDDGEMHSRDVIDVRSGFPSPSNTPAALARQQWDGFNNHFNKFTNPSFSMDDLKNKLNPPSDPPADVDWSKDKWFKKWATQQASPSN